MVDRHSKDKINFGHTEAAFLTVTQLVLTDMVSQLQMLPLLKSEAHPDYQPAPVVAWETNSKDVFETRTGNKSAEECHLTAEGELRAQPHAFFRGEPGTSNSSSIPAISLLSTLPC